MKKRPFPPKLNVKNVRLRVDFRTIHDDYRRQFEVTDHAPFRKPLMDKPPRQFPSS